MSNIPFADQGLLEEIKKFARIKHIVHGETLIMPGERIFFVPIVLKGVLRVVRRDEYGKEIFLYHLYPQQTCAMAINCCQSQKESMIKAIAEDDTDVLQIPVKFVEDWFKYPEWKAYINSAYGSRFANLIEVIDLIAFNNMDKQVLHYLQERSKASGSLTLQLTHQQIADELHTHREAVSRLLRNMEKKNIVSLGRNTIKLLSA